MESKIEVNKLEINEEIVHEFLLKIASKKVGELTLLELLNIGELKEEERVPHIKSLFNSEVYSCLYKDAEASSSLESMLLILTQTTYALIIEAVKHLTLQWKANE